MKSYINRTEKGKKSFENKENLIEKLIQEINNDSYNWQDFSTGLMREALWKRTQKELKQILYGN